MKVIVHTDINGNCVITTPTVEYMSTPLYKGTDGEDDVYFTDEEKLTLLGERVSGGSPYRITESSNLPTDRTYRGAWTDSNPTDTVDINLDKAKDIHMQILRSERDEALRILDIETLKGIDVQSAKQILRDLPDTIDLTRVTTIEELSSIWPEELKRK